MVATMSSHPCPFGVGELLALYAIVLNTHHNPELAARLKEHADQHYPEGEPQ
jgi:hypothetical protein